MCTLLPPRCLTCSLGLQDVQWALGNSRGARKLTQTPHANNKNKKSNRDENNNKTITHDKIHNRRTDTYTNLPYYNATFKKASGLNDVL